MTGNGEYNIIPTVMGKFIKWYLKKPLKTKLRDSENPLVFNGRENL